MPLNQPTISRARVRDRYALMPLDGVPASRIPRWKETAARILAGPALGSGFVEMHLSLAAGGGVHQPGDDRTQTFIYVLSGGAELTIASHRVMVGAGGFAYVPHAADYEVRAPIATTLLLIRKRFEPLPGVSKPEPLTGNQANISAEIWRGSERTRVQTLLPDDISYDMEVNLFTFDVGHGMPGIETHVMEHGAFLLEGAGNAYLGEESHEVQAGDFIWTGPYCPHGLVASGGTVTLLSYKNMNRDITL
jgi:(S)-ureidoglycine aminohydrolase